MVRQGTVANYSKVAVLGTVECVDGVQSWRPQGVAAASRCSRCGHLCMDLFYIPMQAGLLHACIPAFTCCHMCAMQVPAVCLSNVACYLLGSWDVLVAAVWALKSLDVSSHGYQSVVGMIMC